MAFAVKTTPRVQAWEFGAGSGMEQELVRSGKIVAHADGIAQPVILLLL